MIEDDYVKVQKSKSLGDAGLGQSVNCRIATKRTSLFPMGGKESVSYVLALGKDTISFYI
jgi:hypothetical protein